MQTFFEYFSFETMKLSIDGKFIVKFSNCTVLKDIQSYHKKVLRGQNFELVTIEDNFLYFFDIDANSKFLISVLELNMDDVTTNKSSSKNIEITFSNK